MKSYTPSPSRVIVFFFLLIIINITPSQAANYYVSENGNDLATGLSPENAWQTIDKVNASMALFKPGDSILFQRGDVFRGQITITVSGSEGSPIFFGAYGDGPAPVISGGRTLTANWTQSATDPNIYYTDATGFGTIVRNFSADYKIQPLSRFPDTGYNRISSGNGRNSFTDNALASTATNYWTGGDAVIKTFRWVIDRLPITSQTGGTFNLGGNTTYAINYGGDVDGYFILNHVNAINLAGEWSYNSSEHRFYYYKPAGVDLDTSVIEASFYDHAFRIDNETDITIQNLDIRYQNSHAIKMVSALRVSVLNNSFSNIGINGIDAYQCSYLKVNNNNFRYIYNNGIRIYALMHVDVETNKFHQIHGNTLNNIATVPGFGQNDNGQYIGIYFTYGGGVDITNNRLDTIGFNGIHFTHCYDALIKNNVIKYTNFVKDDGAAIYSWADKSLDAALMRNNRVIGNIILNSIGCIDGDFTDLTYQAYGLYFDDRSQNLTVEGNTSYNSGSSGILAKGIVNCIFRDNLVYKATNFAAYFRSSNNGVQPVGNRITYNQFCKDTVYRFLEYYRTADIYTHANNIIDSNYLFSPFKKEIVRYDRTNNALPTSLWYQYLTLPQWRTFGVDLHAKETPLTFQESLCPTKAEFIRFEYNENDTNRTVVLDAPYRDKDNNLISTGSIVLKPFSSVLLFKDLRSLLSAEYTPEGEDTSFCQRTITQSEYTTHPYPGTTSLIWNIVPAEAASLVKKNDTTVTVNWALNFSGMARLYYVVTTPDTTLYSQSLTINVKATPISPLTSIGPTSLLFPVLTTTYKVRDANITDYDWCLLPASRGSITDHTRDSIVVTWATDFTLGTATIGVKIGNECGMSDTTKYTITMGSLFAPSGPVNVCADSYSTYTTPRLPQANLYRWRIDPPDAGRIIPNDTSVTVYWDPDFDGLVNVFVTDSNATTGFGLVSPPLEVTVNPRAIAPARITGPTAIVYPSPLVSYSVAENSTFPYRWTVTRNGVVTYLGNTKSINVDWGTSPGTAVLAASLSNYCGFSDSATLTVTLNPILAPTGATSVCQGTATSVYTAMVIPQATGYSWKIEPSSAVITISSTTRTATVTWDPAFKDTAYISFTTTGTIMSSPKLRVIFIPTLDRPQAITGPDTIVHPGSLASYFIDETPTRYRWSLIPATGAGTITNGNTKNININWNRSFKGDAYVVSQIANNCNWSDSTKLLVHIDTISAPVGVINACHGSSQVYSAMAIPGISAYDWQISPPEAGASTSDTRSTNINWADDFSGTAEITFTAADTMDSPPLLVNITPRPTAPLFITGRDSIMQSTVSSNYSVTDTADKYFWSIPRTAGKIAPDTTMNITVLWNSSFSGNTVLSLYIQGECGFSDTTKLDILVESNNLKIPNVFTPNGDGANDFWEITNINLYPEAIVTIYNRFNKKVHEFRPSQGEWNGNAGGKPLETGNYMYVIKINSVTKPIMGYVTIIR